MHASIGIIGTGYVGLISAVGFAELGNSVQAVDIDRSKIQALQLGKTTIYEKGLSEALNKHSDRITFTSEVSECISLNNIIILAVGTPMDSKGFADISYTNNAVQLIAKHMTSYKIIIIKSTVPAGTHAKIKRTLVQNGKIEGKDFDLVSNPEFLREGNALEDFLRPDRIVIGCRDHPPLKNKMKGIYASLSNKIIFCSSTEAELSKYAANAFLACKISFINELARLSEVLGTNITTIAHIMGMDSRISHTYLKPGPGYGGSCLPKDTMALLRSAQEHNVHLNILDATIKANLNQKEYTVAKLLKMMQVTANEKNSLLGKIIAIWGLTFKADTDDIRESSAIEIVKHIIMLGAHVQAYDPLGTEAFSNIFPQVTYFNNAQQTSHNADLLIVHTDWEEFSAIDMHTVADSMRSKRLLDLRNIYNRSEMEGIGFIYEAVGR